MFPSLPQLDDPSSYLGLFIFDFGTHLGIGYTAGEIGILRQSPEHKHGAVYRICRVDSDGSIDLRGVTHTDWGRTELICFALGSESAARQQYERILNTARQFPVPARVEVQFGRYDELSPSYVVSMRYPQASSEPLASWLTRVDLAKDATVWRGADALAKLHNAQGLGIARGELESRMDFRDRSPDVVLATTGDVFQRRPTARNIPK